MGEVSLNEKDEEIQRLQERLCWYALKELRFKREDSPPSFTCRYDLRQDQSIRDVIKSFNTSLTSPVNQATLDRLIVKSDLVPQLAVTCGLADHATTVKKLSSEVIEETYCKGRYENVLCKDYYEEERWVPGGTITSRKNVYLMEPNSYFDSRKNAAKFVRELDTLAIPGLMSMLNEPTYLGKHSASTVIPPLLVVKQYSIPTGRYLPEGRGMQGKLALKPDYDIYRLRGRVLRILGELKPGLPKEKQEQVSKAVSKLEKVPHDLDMEPITRVYEQENLENESIEDAP